MSDLQIHVTDACIGSRMCVATAPDVMKYDAEAEKARSCGRTATWSEAIAIALACPVSAIELLDPATGSEVDPESLDGGG